MPAPAIVSVRDGHLWIADPGNRRISMAALQ